MYVSLQDIVVDQEGWFSVNSLLSIPIGSYLRIRNRSTVVAKVIRSVTPPNPSSNSGVALGAGDMTGSYLEIPSGSAEVWVRGKGLILTVDVGQDPVPDGLYSGLRAMTIQSYDEANKKNGTQWSASRRLPTAAQNVHNLSIIKTGAKPIDLKRREFAFSGEGLVADIFESPVYTGGTVDPVYNSNGMVTQGFDFQLLVGFSITGGNGSGDTFPINYGTKFAPSIYAIGPKSNQGKGVATALYGSNYILAPNKSYLLVFYSIDPATQDIAARVEGYNGLLDLPLQ